MGNKIPLGVLAAAILILGLAYAFASRSKSEAMPPPRPGPAPAVATPNTGNPQTAPPVSTGGNPPLSKPVTRKPQGVVDLILSKEDPGALGEIADKIARGLLVLSDQDIDGLIALIRGTGKDHHRLIAIEILSPLKDRGGVILAALFDAGRLEEPILSHRALELLPLHAKSNRDLQQDITRFLMGVVTSPRDMDTRTVAIDAVDYDTLDGAESQRFSQLLGDPDEEIRSSAIGRLGQTTSRKSEAIQVLSAAYRNEKNLEVKRDIINAVWQAGDREAIPVLESMKGVAPELDRQIGEILKALK